MSSLFSKPKMPEIPPPTPMPDEAVLRRIGRRTAADERQRGGRQSTLLTSGGRETLGTASGNR